MTSRLLAGWTSVLTMPKQVGPAALVSLVVLLFGAGGTAALGQYRISELEKTQEGQEKTLKDIKLIVCMMCKDPECQRLCFRSQ